MWNFSHLSVTDCYSQFVSNHNTFSIQIEKKYVRISAKDVIKAKKWKKGFLEYTTQTL